MQLTAALALRACAVAVGVCGVLAFLASDDERRVFVEGSTKASVLPSDVLMVDAEVGDEYEDTDEEAGAIRPLEMEVEIVTVVKRRPTPAVPLKYDPKARAQSQKTAVLEETPEQQDLAKQPDGIAISNNVDEARVSEDNNCISI